MRKNETEIGVCLLDNDPVFAALTRAHTGLGELRPLHSRSPTSCELLVRRAREAARASLKSFNQIGR